MQKFLKYGDTLHAVLRDFFQGHFYLYMIFTLDVHLKPNTHKMLPYCATIYKVDEKLQKEKHYTEEA